MYLVCYLTFLRQFLSSFCDSYLDKNMVKSPLTLSNVSIFIPMYLLRWRFVHTRLKTRILPAKWLQPKVHKAQQQEILAHPYPLHWVLWGRTAVPLHDLAGRLCIGSPALGRSENFSEWTIPALATPSRKWVTNQFLSETVSVTWWRRRQIDLRRWRLEPLETESSQGRKFPRLWEYHLLPKQLAL